MEKLTLTDLRERMGEWKRAVVVFTEGSFSLKYEEESRSYEIYSTEKYFDPSMIGNSLHGNCLDGKDDGVRLDWYIGEEWEVDYVYIVE